MKCFFKCLFSPLALTFQFVWLVFVGVPAMLLALMFAMTGCLDEATLGDTVDSIALWPTNFYKSL